MSAKSLKRLRCAGAFSTGTRQRFWSLLAHFWTRSGGLCVVPCGPSEDAIPSNPGQRVVALALPYRQVAQGAAPKQGQVVDPARDGRLVQNGATAPVRRDTCSGNPLRLVATRVSRLCCFLLLE